MEFDLGACTLKGFVREEVEISRRSDAIEKG